MGCSPCLVSPLTMLRTPLLLNPYLVYILDCLSNHKWLGVRNWVAFSLCGHSFEGAHHPVISKPKTLHGCHMSISSSNDMKVVLCIMKREKGRVS
jgi:hypothetical protein